MTNSTETAEPGTYVRKPLSFLRERISGGRSVRLGRAVQAFSGSPARPFRPVRKKVRAIGVCRACLAGHPINGQTENWES